LLSFRNKLIQEFRENPDLYIFDVDLPHFVRRLVINRINQYIPKNVPAVALAKTNDEPELMHNSGFPIKLLIYNSEKKEEREWIKEAVSNFWSSINGLK
ncbi:MAG: hypothetical protein JXR31_06885, partial [Prolixibacteraceae bacterium]|nr:hypothetical protein [Prolixibacteraceae bacterium]